jgi:hypothetical protein
MKMEGQTNGEPNKAELPAMENSKITLKIWDVPLDLGKAFIGKAKSQYANKSWLLLQDLMRKADLFDQIVSSGKMEELEKRIVALESKAVKGAKHGKV